MTRQSGYSTQTSWSRAFCLQPVRRGGWWMSSWLDSFGLPSTIALSWSIEPSWRDRSWGSMLCDARRVLAILQFQVHVTALPWPHPALPDEDDVMFLEVAMETRARTVVTGNIKHFRRASRGPVTVMSPRTAWELFVKLGLR